MSAPTITCSSGHSNPVTRKFCGDCGMSLGVCLNGHQNPQERRYCGECGIPLQSLGEGAGPVPVNASTAPIGADIEQDGGSAASASTTQSQSTTSQTPARPPRRRNKILAVASVTVAVVISLFTVAVSNQGGPVALPFSGLNEPSGVAADEGGAVYVTDPLNHRVLKLEAGSGTQTVLPFTELVDPVGVAVDRSGAVYVVNQEHRPRILKLGEGSDVERAVLPVYWPNGVAVDTGGAVYVTGAARRVLKVPAGCIDGQPATSWLCAHVNVLRSAFLAVRG